MDNILIRKVKYEDIESVVDIQIGGWKSAYRGIIEDEYLDKMDKESKIEKRKNDYNKNGFIVAEYNGELVGFSRFIESAAYTPEVENIDCELLALYVKTEYKGQGIGRKLMEYVKHEFKSNGKRRMVLWCLKDNFKSRGFYERMGGKIVAERKIKIGNKDYMEVCFQYDLK